MRDSKSFFATLCRLPEVTRRVSSCGPTDVHRAGWQSLLIRLMEGICRLCLFLVQVGVREGLTDILG